MTKIQTISDIRRLQKESEEQWFQDESSALFREQRKQIGAAIAELYSAVPLPVDQIVGYLKVLRNMATEACNAANEAKVDGTINWGDLRCVEAMLAVNDEGEAEYRVVIEEADPFNEEFQQWVQDWLRERGHDCIVVTEW